MLSSVYIRTVIHFTSVVVDAWTHSGQPGQSGCLQPWLCDNSNCAAIRAVNGTASSFSAALNCGRMWRYVAMIWALPISEVDLLHDSEVLLGAHALRLLS